MDNSITAGLFCLLRLAMTDGELTAEERALLTPEALSSIFALAKKHDIAHLAALGLQKSGVELSSAWSDQCQQSVFNAVYRYEQLRYTYEAVCGALEAAEIPFLPLKGSVLRAIYPEPWMRTSCDMDILVKKEQLSQATAVLVETCHMTAKVPGAHDVSLYSPEGVHVELHFDLVEEGRAADAMEVLRGVWDTADRREGHCHWYTMPDELFYFYHIAHMAKHFEVGGCGIRPFMDLWLLDALPGADVARRDDLLRRGKLLAFANAARRLSRVWLAGEEPDALCASLQQFILTGGVYGSPQNRVALQQQKKGGRMGYLLSRAFIPMARLKRYYPVLERQPWLMPVMQVRRWFMLLNPDVAAMAKREMATNSRMETAQAEPMADFLQALGL